MTFSPTRTFTYAQTGLTTAAAGNVIRAATWDAGWTEVQTALSQLGAGSVGYPRLIAGTSLVNFNTANTDTAITITSPTTLYRFVSVIFSSPTASLSTANWGLFSAAGGGGTQLFAAGQAMTITTAAANVNNNFQAVNFANVSTFAINFTTLFFRVGTAQGSPATANVSISIEPLP